jgi:hypothetical protein
MPSTSSGPADLLGQGRTWTTAAAGIVAMGAAALVWWFSREYHVLLRFYLSDRPFPTVAFSCRTVATSARTRAGTSPVSRSKKSDEVDMDTEQSDEMNERRKLKRRTARLLDEIVLNLATEVDSILRDLPSMTLVERVKLVPELLKMLATAKDMQSADRWNHDLRLAIMNNPRLLDLSSGEASRKVGSRAARLQKLLTPDRRQQGEKKREQGIEKLTQAYYGEPSKLPPGAVKPEPKKRIADSLLDDLPEGDE